MLGNARYIERVLMVYKPTFTSRLGSSTQRIYHLPCPERKVWIVPATWTSGPTRCDSAHSQPRWPSDRRRRSGGAVGSSRPEKTGPTGWLLCQKISIYSWLVYIILLWYVYILHIYMCIMCVYVYLYIGRKNDVYETIHPTLNQDNDPQEMGCRKILWKRQTLFLNKRINGFCYVLFVLDQPRSSG